MLLVGKDTVDGNRFAAMQIARVVRWKLEFGYIMILPSCQAPAFTSYMSLNSFLYLNYVY
jgi:hypothetical protein